MELYWVWMSGATLLACYIFLNKFLRRLNGWYYDLKLRKKQRPLPPGDMGWPLIGNLIAFMKDLSSGNLDSFINNLVSRYGRSGIYKTHLFGKPGIIICTPEMCRQVLRDDENFKASYPRSVAEFFGSKVFTDVSNIAHKSIRRLVTAPIVGDYVLARYLVHIEEIVINSLEELCSMKHPIEIFKELKRVPFKVITNIFMGSLNPTIITKIQDLYTELMNCNPIFCVPINLPGFAFHKALKVRKKLFKLVLSVLDERRLMIKNGQIKDKKDLIDILLEAKKENIGQDLEDKDIVDVFIGLLFAGHETTTIGLMWSLLYLTQHPDVLKKAKEEQEEIVRARPPSQKQLSHTEIKQMVYLSQVIDEMLRLTNIAFSIFRESTTDVNINGYIIPKGWNVLVWTRAIHMNPDYYPNPEEFNPSRWDDYNAKIGTFLPFGVGSMLCPGKDLSNLQISVFLHYFLLNYGLEKINPEGRVPNFSYSYPKDLAKVIKVNA